MTRRSIDARPYRHRGVASGSHRPTAGSMACIDRACALCVGRPARSPLSFFARARRSIGEGESERCLLGCLAALIDTD